MIARMGSEIKGIIKSVLEISYYSRGAWSYHAVLSMTQAEREMAVELINERLKVASKQMFPVY